VPKDRQWLERMIVSFRERAKTLDELVEMSRYLLSDDYNVDEKG
jgi:hypothetical protein